jgi:phenylacetate-CoA ligase
MRERLLWGAIATNLGRLLNRGSIATSHRIASRASSPYTVRSIQAWKFRRTLQHAVRHSAFYRDLLRKHGLRAEDISHPAEMGEAYTSAQDLLDHPAQAFLCGPADIAYETSGSTKTPKTLYYSYAEVEEATRLMAVGLYHVGMRASDRVVSTQDFDYWTGGPWFARAVTKLGAFSSCPGKVPPTEIYRRMDRHGYNVLIGDVSWILRFTDLAEKQGPKPLRLVLGASEALSESSRDYVERVWGARMYMCYGCSEGAGGMECEFRHGYHLNEFSYVWEILDPDADGYGEVVFTTLDRTTMPLIRYRAGDVARLIPERCDCGIITQRLSALRGRTDEVVNVGGESMDPASFESIFAEIPEVSGSWQAVIHHRNHQDVCELRLELESGDIASVSERFKDVLRAQVDTAWKDYQLGLFDLQFTEVPRGELRTERKLRRVVDARR